MTTTSTRDGSGACWPTSWIGDGVGDCYDQPYEADLTCYGCDGDDCTYFSPPPPPEPLLYFMLPGMFTDLWLEGCYNFTSTY